MQLFGIEGRKAYEDGGDWQNLLRGWDGFSVPKSRLNPKWFQVTQEAMEKNLVPPTDEFIKTIADEYNLPYTIGKKGNDRFYSDDGDPIYPPNHGAVGETELIDIPAGISVLSRYGNNGGRFVSPVGTSFEERALPRTTDEEDYHVFTVVRTIESVEKGIIAPWFGRRGGGIQFEFKKRIVDLISQGYLKEEST